MKIIIENQKITPINSNIEKSIIEYLKENEYTTNKTIKEKFNLKDAKSKINIIAYFSTTFILQNSQNNYRTGIKRIYFTHYNNCMRGDMR